MIVFPPGVPAAVNEAYAWIAVANPFLPFQVGLAERARNYRKYNSPHQPPTTPDLTDEAFAVLADKINDLVKRRG